jgi:hypothetical protein
MLGERLRVETTARPLQQKLSIARQDEREMRRAETKKRLKKRHVELLTRLPTKRMATACWAFIVAKSPSLETAPLLDFTPLRVTNKKNCQQFIHKCLWAAWG